MTKKHFTEYQPKLTFEAILKSALAGVAVGFGAGLVLGLIFWLFGIEITWILIATTLGVACASGLLFYFLRFVPTEKSNAARLDRLGLEERMVTMVELEGDDSYIAEIQRRDAEASLKSIDKSQLKIKIPRLIIILSLVFFILGTGMITVNVLTELGLMPGGDEIIEDLLEDEFVDYVTVTYEAEDGGTIDGESDQDIVKGTDTTVVTAVADEGYMFKEWSDGVASPTRFDQKVTESVVYTAIFIALEDEEGEESENGQGDGDPFGENGGSSQEPGEEGAPSGEGEFNPNANAGGGQREPNNQIIDGNTFYKEVLEYYQDLAAGRIEDNGGLSEEEINLIKQYLGIV